MKHAGSAALDGIEDVLAAVRKHDGLREPKRGTFYRRSGAFLHFHEDPAGMFADLKEDGEFVRYRINTAAEKRALLREVARALGAG
jgi:hypothetical protein